MRPIARSDQHIRHIARVRSRRRRRVISSGRRRAVGERPLLAPRTGLALALWPELRSPPTSSASPRWMRPSTFSTRKTAPGANFSDDPLHFGPEVARVGFAAAFAGHAEGLRRTSGSEDMNLAAPWPAVEGSEIVPHRRALSRAASAIPGHESGRGVGFPLRRNQTVRYPRAQRMLTPSSRPPYPCAEGEAEKRV